MTLDDRSFLRDFFQQTIDQPLTPSDERYVPLYRNPDLTGFDPVESLVRTIDWTEDESVQLLSGFRGTGKSTELRRLKRDLKQLGYIVLLCDIEDYLNLSTPVDASDFLLAISGAFGEKLDKRGLLGDSLKESWGTRISDLMRSVRIDPEIGIDPPGGFSAKIKLSLKNDPSFKRRVQERMAGHLATLVDEVRSYFSECVAAVRRSKGEDCQLVLLLDSIEHIRGTTVNANEVQSSVETLFVSHADKLKLTGVHVVYTVPPYLKVRHSNLGSLYEPGGVQMLPAFKLCDRRGTRLDDNYDAMEAVVAARGDWEKLLPNRESLDLLIRYSGGHLRDLLRLVAEVLRRAETVPVSEDTVRSAIDQLRTEFLPIADEDARWLDEISKTHLTALDSVRNLPTLARFLDTHLALCYRNGDEWYDIHPLIAEQVATQAAIKSAE